jgi:CDP-paratose 2-epimerase
MKVLITGGCGFLGSNIAASFLQEENEVVVIDALFRQGGELNLQWLQSQSSPTQFKNYQIDLADDEAVETVFQKKGPFDYICHLGGQVAMTTSLTDPRRDLKTNILGTFNILEAMRSHSPNALLAYSSTNKVYGDLEWLTYEEQEKRYTVPSHPFGFEESLPLDFASPYGCSKGSADQYVRDWSRNYGLKTVVFRHSSIYGGRQFATFDQGWIGWFCQKALEQHSARQNGQPVIPFTINGTGKQVRDVLHGSDLISLYQAAYKNQQAAAGQIFNIGGGLSSALSLLELFDLLQELLGLSEPLAFEKLPRRQSDQDFFVANIRKAENLLGWAPRLTSSDGVAAMLNWCRSMHLDL